MKFGDINKSIKMLDDHNFTFMFAQKYHPSMKYAMPTRKELGFKTIFNKEFSGMHHLHFI